MLRAFSNRDPILSALGDHVPLAVDLDGTLILGDTLWESLAVVLRRNPLRLLVYLTWVFRGKAWFKARLAEEVPLNPEQLPWNDEVITYLRMEHSVGRPLFLVTGANQQWAEQVAEYLGIFQGVFGSSDTKNNTGRQKRNCCLHLFGEQGFDYLGDSRKDIAAMWVARRALAVGHGLGRSLHSHGIRPSVVFGRQQSGFKLILRTLRADRWSKNLLLFAPAFLELQVRDPSVIFWALAGAVAFSLVASCCYLVNDLVDLPSDRGHMEKCRRPLASGAMPLWFAFFGAPVLVAASIGIGLLLPQQFLFLLLAYMAGTLAYTFWLKRLLMADITALACLYILRILAGGAATGITVSSWLLVFSICICSSLAFLKRYMEFSPQTEGVVAARTRAYVADDYFLLAAMGVGASIMSVLVLAMYINSESAKVLYSRPSFLWPACPVLMYWLNRLWLLARCEAIGHDPVCFMLRDKTSYLALGVVAVSMLAARFG